MGFKASDPHASKDTRVGPQHIDVYQTNDQGKRVGDKVMKISHNPAAPQVDTIRPPGSLPNPVVIPKE